jgi:hypothetical protein
MSQFGQNAGPCHLSVFGYVCNIKDKKMTETDHTRKDHELLGAFGLVWNMLSVSVPAPVMEACETAMDLAGLPRMGTKEDSAGKFFIYMLLWNLTIYIFRLGLYHQF